MRQVMPRRNNTVAAPRCNRFLVSRRFLVPAKGCEAPKPLLAHTSNVAIGLLRVGGACKRERGDGG